MSMTEGVNMGRQCPWTKEYLKSLYNKLHIYCKALTFNTLAQQGQQAAMDTMATYTMFKFPVVYVFVHYHYGNFETLSMPQNEISSYLMFLPMIKQVAEEMLNGLADNTVFVHDSKNELTPALRQICKEVILIEEM